MTGPVEQRDHYIRLFNRLEAAISHHKKGKSDLFVDEVDEALYAARDRVLRDAATSPDAHVVRTGPRDEGLVW